MKKVKIKFQDELIVYGKLEKNVFTILHEYDPRAQMFYFKNGEIVPLMSYTKRQRLELELVKVEKIFNEFLYKSVHTEGRKFGKVRELYFNIVNSYSNKRDELRKILFKS